jgi:hypothetical protein
MGVQGSGILEVLAFRCPMWQMNPPFFPNVVINLPRLHTLILQVNNMDAVMGIVARWNLPQLCHVVCFPDDIRVNQLNLPFFERFGPKLLSFETETITNFSTWEVLSFCTSLERLLISVHFLSTPLPFLPRLPEIQLDPCFEHKCLCCWVRAMNTLLEMKWPSLARIRISNNIGYSWRKSEAFYRELASMWHKVPVQIELPSGELVINVTDFSITNDGWYATDEEYDSPNECPTGECGEYEDADSDGDDNDDEEDYDDVIDEYLDSK